MNARSHPRRPHRPGTRVWWIGGIVAAVIAIGGIVLVTRPGPSRVGSDPSEDFPFPCLPMEGGQQHIHPYLRIFVNGEPVPVPASIGIRALPGGGACLEPVHTHDASGIIHIESTSPSQTYTLADFFAIWRATYHTVNIGGRSEPLSYTLSDFLGHRPGLTHPVQLLVDGNPSPAGPWARATVSHLAAR